jgi:predicted  nucleic acid-binding Zn-ribbon protein
MTSSDSNGWDQYSKLVLRELESLADGVNGLKNEIEALKREITEMRAKEDKVAELIDWKKRVDEVASPSQIKDLQKQVAHLQDFKVKATTAFVVVQMVVAAAFALIKLF